MKKEAEEAIYTIKNCETWQYPLSDEETEALSFAISAIEERERLRDKVKEIDKLLDDIDGFACDSRSCYENARGNDSACYNATNKIRLILAETEGKE